MKSLFSAYWAFTKSLEKGMKDYGLNYGNPKVILYIMRNEGCRQIDIAKDCYIESATLSTVLSKMEKNGLIERRRTPENRRCYSIYPTDKGRKTFHKVKSRLDETTETAFSDFSKDDIDQFREYLDRLTYNLINDEQVK